jgi:hypothetical protein
MFSIDQIISDEIKVNRDDPLGFYFSNFNALPLCAAI